MPTGLTGPKRELMPHQVEALEFMRGRQNFALFMEMRLGKTLSVIRYAQEMNLEGPCLVVAPMTVLGAWVSELRQEGEQFLRTYNEKGTPTRIASARSAAKWAKQHPTKRCWILLHYEGLRAASTLAYDPYAIAVLDESTRIKNPSAQITQLCCSGFNRVQHRCILTGSPAPEGPQNFFCQFYFVNKTFLGCNGFYQFRSKYFNPPTEAWQRDWYPKPGAFNMIQAIVQQLAFVKRRSEVNVGSRKMYMQRTVRLSPEARRLYNQVLKDFATDQSETQWKVVVQVWLARIAGGFTPEGELISPGKCEELIELLQTDLRLDQVVVWFRFNDELRYVERRLNELGMSTASILGETPVSEREALIYQFQQGERAILLAQIKCGRYGINVSAADAEIYYSNGYSLEDRKQSEERIVHPSKTKPLMVLDLVSEDTVDEDVLAALRDKGVTADTFMMKFRKSFAERLDEYLRRNR